MNRKIKIAGAGISGLVAGITLSKNGYEVGILEKRSNVGSFFKKDVHSLRNYAYDYDVIDKYKELGIEISNVHPIFKELRFSPSLKKLEIYSDHKPLFYNVIRGFEDKLSLDKDLLAQAEDAGVKIHFNQMVDINSDEVDIMATGSQVANGIAYGKHYKKRSPIDSIYYFLNNEIAQQGYIYITPFSNEFSVVIATTKIESKEKMEERFDKFIRENQIVKDFIEDAEFENDIFGMAYYGIKESAVKNGVLYIGEAAGFLDASSGFGTHYAIISGYLAAMSIIEGSDYDSLWKKYFGNDLKNKYAKRQRLERMRNDDYEVKLLDMINKCDGRISIDQYRSLKNKGDI